MYTVPLSAVNGLSRLTKLTTSKGAGTTDSIRKFSISANPFRIESNRNRMAYSNSNRISKLRRSILYVCVWSDTCRYMGLQQEKI